MGLAWTLAKVLCPPLCAPSLPEDPQPQEPQGPTLPTPHAVPSRSAPGIRPRAPDQAGEGLFGAFPLGSPGAAAENRAWRSETRSEPQSPSACASPPGCRGASCSGQAPTFCAPSLAEGCPTPGHIRLPCSLQSPRQDPPVPQPPALRCPESPGALRAGGARSWQEEGLSEPEQAVPRQLLVLSPQARPTGLARVTLPPPPLSHVA